MRLVWGKQSRKYEAGLDRGVFYPENAPGVVWNGLISVDESSDGGEVSSYYFDGVKYLDIVNTRTFQADLTAFSAPEGFSASLGDLSVVPGFILTRQRRGRFGLSYRTMVNEEDYKLHLVYNCLASLTTRGYASMGGEITVNPHTWAIDAVPPPSTTHKPSAHFIFDTQEMNLDAIAVIEAILYGTETTDARMPTIAELTNLLADWDPLVVVPHTDTGLAELISGSGDLYRTADPGVLGLLPGSHLYESPDDGIYRLE